jgi:hypothetical protein
MNNFKVNELKSELLKNGKDYNRYEEIFIKDEIKVNKRLLAADLATMIKFANVSMLPVIEKIVDDIFPLRSVENILLMRMIEIRKNGSVEYCNIIGPASEDPMVISESAAAKILEAYNLFTTSPNKPVEDDDKKHI